MTDEQIYEKAFNEGVASALSAKDWASDYLDGEDHERSPDFVAGFVAGAVETRKDTAKVLLTAAQSIRESTRLVRIAHEKLTAAEEAMENMKAMVEHAKILMYESQTAVAEVQRLRDYNTELEVRIEKATTMLRIAMGPGYELVADLFKLIEKLPQRLADEYYRGWSDRHGDGFVE